MEIEASSSLLEKLSESFHRITDLETQNSLLRLKLKLTLRYCLKPEDVREGLVLSAHSNEASPQKEAEPVFQSPEQPKKSTIENELEALATPKVIELSNTLSNLKWGFKKRESLLKKELSNYKQALQFLYANHEELRAKYKAICNSLCDQLDATEVAQSMRLQQRDSLKNAEKNAVAMIQQMDSHDQLVEQRLLQVSQDIQLLAEEAQTQLESSQEKTKEAQSLVRAIKQDTEDRALEQEFLMQSQLAAATDAAFAAAAAATASVPSDDFTHSKSAKDLNDSRLERKASKAKTTDQTSKAASKETETTTHQQLLLAHKQSQQAMLLERKASAAQLATEVQTNKAMKQRLKQAEESQRLMLVADNVFLQAMSETQIALGERLLEAASKEQADWKYQHPTATLNSSEESAQYSSSTNTQLKLAEERITLLMAEKANLEDEIRRMRLDFEGKDRAKWRMIQDLEARNVELSSFVNNLSKRSLETLSAKKTKSRNPRHPQKTVSRRVSRKQSRIQGSVDSYDSNSEHNSHHGSPSGSNSRQSYVNDSTDLSSQTSVNSPVSVTESEDVWNYEQEEGEDEVSNADELSRFLFSPKEKKKQSKAGKADERRLDTRDYSPETAKLLRDREKINRSLSSKEVSSKKMSKQKVSGKQLSSKKLSTRSVATHRSSERRKHQTRTDGHEDEDHPHKQKHNQLFGSHISSLDKDDDEELQDDEDEDVEDEKEEDDAERRHDADQDHHRSLSRHNSSRQSSRRSSRRSLKDDDTDERKLLLARNSTRSLSERDSERGIGHRDSARSLVSWQRQEEDGDDGSKEEPEEEDEEEESVEVIDDESLLMESFVPSPKHNPTKRRESRNSETKTSTDKVTQWRSSQSLISKASQRSVKSSNKDRRGNDRDDDDASQPMSVEELLLGTSKSKAANNLSSSSFRSTTSQRSSRDRGDARWNDEGIGSKEKASSKQQLQTSNSKSHQRPSKESGEERSRAERPPLYRASSRTLGRGRGAAEEDKEVRTGDEGDLDKEDSFDAAEALEELRELLHTAEVQRERYALLLQETERERDDAHLHHATTQNALQALQRQYDSLAKDNLRLKREVDLYRTKIFTVINAHETSAHGSTSLLQGLPEINISFLSNSASASASALAAEFDYLSPSTTSSQALYIVHQLVSTHNDLVTRNEALVQENQRLQQALTEKDQHLHVQVRKVSEQNQRHSKLQQLLQQANATIATTSEDYHVLQAQVTHLTHTLQEATQENAQLKALMSPTKRNPALEQAASIHHSSHLNHSGNDQGGNRKLLLDNSSHGRTSNYHTNMSRSYAEPSNVDSSHHHSNNSLLPPRLSKQPTTAASAASASSTWSAYDKEEIDDVLSAASAARQLRSQNRSAQHPPMTSGDLMKARMHAATASTSHDDGLRTAEASTTAHIQGMYAPSSSSLSLHPPPTTPTHHTAPLIMEDISHGGGHSRTQPVSNSHSTSQYGASSVQSPPLPSLLNHNLRSPSPSRAISGSLDSATDVDTSLWRKQQQLRDDVRRELRSTDDLLARTHLGPLGNYNQHPTAPSSNPQSQSQSQSHMYPSHSTAASVVSGDSQLPQHQHSSSYSRRDGTGGGMSSSASNYSNSTYQNIDGGSSYSSSALNSESSSMRARVVQDYHASSSYLSAGIPFTRIA